ncbi:MAG: hypothetical protein OXD54_11185 [Candidatus Poribacteria bacterium]|nr:hypothetical protein [Candidatus Poribacteria bacterium]
MEITITWQLVLLCGLSLCVGWGIRGNFGHEYGAALPGALAAMAIVLLSGREDWWRYIHYFALFGALGWSFGGSMSYMMVVGYSHSSHSPTVLYGFANLFVIGFLWAALGGAGTALPAFLSGIEQNGYTSPLSVFFLPICAVFIGWSLQAVIIDRIFAPKRMQRHESPLYWYDTDWLAALVAIVAALIVILIRGQIDMGTSLILYMGIGWFVAFLLLVNIFKLRMTPPRGDNWAGCVGMVVGVLVYCWQYKLSGVAFVTLMAGFTGGIAFSFGQLIKLLCLRTGLQTNWHSVMEQVQGLLFGIGLAITFGYIINRSPTLETDPNIPRWIEMFTIFCIIIALTYLNYRKAVQTWVDTVESLPDRFFGLPVVGWFRHSRGWIGWFEIFYIALTIALITVLAVNLQEPIPFFSGSWVGKGQLLYLVFVWWIVIFNFERALVNFSPHRLVTEGVITLNAIICTILVAIYPQTIMKQTGTTYSFSNQIWTVIIWGIVVMVGTTFAFWGIKHALYGREHAPGASLHIRFGEESNAPKEKPKTGEPHP